MEWWTRTRAGGSSTSAASLVADILDGLGAEEWSTPSLCDGWSVRDVGAHLSIAATSSVREVLPWMLKSRAEASTG